MNGVDFMTFSQQNKAFDVEIGLERFIVAPDLIAFVGLVAVE